MPLQLGNWRINSNGFEGNLVIESVSAAGAVTGSLNTLTGNRIIGFWEESSQELTFSPIAEGGKGMILPVFYKGYLFSTPAGPQPGQDVVCTLTGFFQLIDDAGVLIPIQNVNAKRNIFGWHAQINVIL
jgi:hypothetical protein